MRTVNTTRGVNMENIILFSNLSDFEKRFVVDDMNTAI